MKTWNTIRYLEYNSYFLLFALLFMVAFYWVYFATWANKIATNYNLNDFFVSYWNLLPLVLWVLSIALSYILLSVFVIIRISWFITKLCTYFAIYGLWLALWIQLKYYEPRFTDVAKFLIDHYSFPLIISSASVILIVIVFSFFKKN